MRELSLNILDIITNSIEAESTRVVLFIEETEIDNVLSIKIRDNGRGMPQEFVNKVLDPFVTSRSTRPIGMGLSLLHQLARQARGDLNIKSQVGKGTDVMTTFRLHCLNRPPLGDIADTLINLCISNLDVHFGYRHTTDFGKLWFDSYRLLAQMAKEDCSVYKVMQPAKEFIRKQLKKIKSQA